MKIGFNVTHVSQKAGGIAEAVKGLARAIVGQGEDLRIFACEDEYLGRGVRRWNGLDVVVSRRLGPANFSFQRGLTSAVAAWAPDTMHVHGLWMHPSWATRHWEKCGIPYVVAPHGMLDPWALSHSRVAKRVALRLFERRSLDRAACIHVLSEAEAAGIAPLGLNRPVAVIPNGITLPGEVASGSPERKVMLFLGRIHPKKGIEELCRAWKIARATCAAARNWRVVIAGWDDGGHAESLLKLCRDEGLQDDIEFHGPVFGEEKKDAFMHADAFILPSKSEGLPMAVLEAWSYRLPVLMTPECNLREAFAAGAAYRVSSETQSLARDLCGFLEMSDDESRAMAEKGLAEAARYSWDMVARRTVDLHRWLSGSASRPDFVSLP